jgi:hypothetical protein
MLLPKSGITMGVTPDFVSDIKTSFPNWDNKLASAASTS